MEYLIIIALIGIIGWILILRRKQNKSTPPIDQKTSFQSPPVQPQPVPTEDKKDTYIEKKYKSLDEQIGIDHCNGLTCHLNDKCQDAEIVFCHTILKQAGIPPEHIIGQFPFTVPTSINASGIAKIDFAIKTPDGRALAIELDGHKSHTELDAKAFNKHQQRQNELVAAGWIVLRFTAYDMLKNTKDCIDLIKKVYSTPERAVTPMDAPIIYADYDTKEAREAAPKKAVYSSIRNKYYTICASAKDFANDKIALMTFWVKCLKQGCDGELTRVKTPGPFGFYWYCKKCRKTYGEVNDNGIPVDKSKQG